MKKPIFIASLLFIIMGSLQGCKDFLKEEVFSQLAPENFLNTKEGLASLLTDTYARTANMNSNNSIYVIAPQEWTTDILFQSGDNVERDARNYIEFTWDPTVDFLVTNWDPPYQAIRDANTGLENITNVTNMSEEEKAVSTAEFRFLRAINYYKLYFFFGSVPLRTSSQQELQLAKASDEEMRSFISSELIAVVNDLPDPGDEAQYGRANKGAALAYLAKFYLNMKDWEQSASYAQQIIALNHYQLFANYEDLFKVENERNPEYIFVRPAFASSNRASANSWMNVSFPDNFQQDPRTGLEFANTWLNWPNEFRILDGFYNSFEEGDKRRNLLIGEYVDKSGQLISLLNNNNTRCFKYWPDPNAQGASHGNDIPDIRYADILLCRAEALNELTGPNNESISLINQVRARAGLAALSQGNFDQQSLREQILRERGWEFYAEGHRRMDLIRMGRFISGAQARGKSNAKDFHVHFPIPQVVMDSDPKLVQNEGY